MPHCTDNRLTDGCKVVSLTRRPRSTPHKYYFSASGTHFCWRLSKSQGLVWPEGLCKLKELIHFIGSRTRDLPACSIVPEPLRYHVPPVTQNRQRQMLTYALGEILSKHYPPLAWSGRRKTRKSCQDSECRGRNSKRELPEYKYSQLQIH
jgi:hypothetical protein